MAKRPHTDDEDSNLLNIAEFQPVISLGNPLTDYKRLMSENVTMDEYVADEIINENYTKIAEATQKCIWELLFAENNSSSDNNTKAAELLKIHKTDSAFYCPWDYNKWILTLREELLKREMLEFWRNVIVKNELGPCWARDSDYFDDMDDKEPEEFYKRAGCIAPFCKETSINNTKSTQTFLDTKTVETQTTGAGRNDSSSEAYVGSSTSSVEASEGLAPTDAANSNHNDDFEPVISLESPVEDYRSLILNKLQLNITLSEDELEVNYKKIAEKAREIIWELLFIQTPLTNENQLKAAELLKEVKSDACFYGPAEYNNWIITVRDELLRQNMIEFWRDQIVKFELGLCWARDCDWFDDMDDLESLEFYNHAGCEAPFKEEIQNSVQNDYNIF
ncbi:uncharacterized protein LOC119689758 [Teleopsis dalmanni]|uniref:uncharacterized protein LOC119689758 n=1 Tax=Teleopsis dalmanni TaxID=139649 RepID=UPI000D32C273|nr:uncharacterized protein LOC119689758 [Teleopsis dalmanni]XP_037960588.1 uncharacterized protein LOC119689758 [Teleopsis dalmanni]